MQQLNLNITEDEKEILTFWKDFFPEFKEDDDLEKLFLRVYNNNIENYLKDREIEDTYQKEFINKIMAFNIKNDNEIIFNNIMDKYFHDFKWIGFFRPLLLKYDDTIKNIINSKLFKDSERAFDLIYCQMLQSLVNRSFRVIVLEINLARQENILLGKDSEERYTYFVKELLLDNNFLAKIYNKYPELIRILDNYLENTTKYLKEILKNLNDEKNSLFMQMEINKDIKLENIEFSHGDTHNGNKSVAKLIFENNFNLMYKPRSLEIEKGYKDLIDWLDNRIYGFKKPYAANVYSNNNYGFMEFINNKECDNPEEISNFYFKMGELLAILYSLNSRDFHIENIIAFGENPVLVDLETLLHKTVEINEEEISSYENILSIIGNSVASISVLPTTMINKKENLIMEVGAMNSGKVQKSPYRTQALEERNTDRIHIKNVYKEIDKLNSSPKSGGRYLSAENYISEIKEGFIKIYRWIEENKDKYYEKIESLFAHKYSRYIYRGTNNYTQLLETSYHPDLLSNKIDRYIYFHRIFTTIDFHNNEKDIEVTKTEILEMLNDDIPMYQIRNDEIYISDMKGNIVLREEGKSILESIEERINTFNEIDLKRQISIINQCFIGCGLKTDIPDGTNTVFDEGIQPRTRTENLNIAIDLTNSMLERGIRNSSKESMSWIGLKGYGNELYENLPLEIDLYNGNSGIIITLIELYKISNEEKYKIAIVESVNYVLEFLETCNVEEVDLGAFSGLYGSFYSLFIAWKSNILPNNDRLIKTLIKKLEESEKYIKQLNNLDIIGGLAGILGVLLTLKDNLTNENPYIDQCLNKIIQTTYTRIEKSAIYVNENMVKWNENHDSGYAHGSSGIITQLVRYYKKYPDIRKLDLIKKSLNYERAYLINESRNKWIIRDNSHYFSWCNGIGGILLTKLYLLNNNYSDEKIKAEIDILIEQLKLCGFRYDKSLCHGDLGSLIILKYAGEICGNTGLVNSSQNLISEVVYKYNDLKKDISMEIEDWGLMTGTSGVILSMLNIVGMIDITKIFLLEDPNIGEVR